MLWLACESRRLFRLEFNPASETHRLETLKLEPKKPSALAGYVVV